MNKTYVKLIYKPFIIYVWSTFINCLFWIFNSDDLLDVIKEKNHIKKQITNIHDIKRFMESYKWTKDKFIDWKPWVITIIAKDFKDDCDGAATIGKWLLNLINIKSDLVVMYGKGKGHMVCVSKDRTILISNNSVMYLSKRKNWRSELRSIFPEYNKIFVL